MTRIIKGFQRKPFIWAAGVTAFTFPLLMALEWLRGFDHSEEPIHEVIIFFAVMSIAIGVSTYCFIVGYHQYVDFLRRECFTEGADPALAQKLYVFRVRGMWMKVLLTMGRLFISCGVISFILYSCDSRIVKSSVAFIVFWLVLAAGSGAAYLIVRRRAFRDMDAGE